MELNKTFIDGLWSKEINVTSFGTFISNTPITIQINSRTRVTREGGITLYCHARPVSPFSWMHCIVMSEEDLEMNDGLVCMINEHISVWCILLAKNTMSIPNFVFSSFCSSA